MPMPFVGPICENPKHRLAFLTRFRLAFPVESDTASGAPVITKSNLSPAGPIPPLAWLLQISMLRDGMMDLAKRCKDTTLRVDGTHLEVHRVQEAAERLLRIELARSDAPKPYKT